MNAKRSPDRCTLTWVVERIDHDQARDDACGHVVQCCLVCRQLPGLEKPVHPRLVHVKPWNMEHTGE